MSKKALILITVLLPIAITPLRGEDDPEKLSESSATMAPSFTLRDINNHAVSLDSLLGKGPIVIDFWATWCKPCLKELDTVNEIYKKYHEKGFEVLAINHDEPRNVAKVKPFAKSRRWTFPVLLDTEGKVRRLYQVKAMPASFILDKEGRIRFTHLGFKTGDEVSLEEEIVSLLDPTLPDVKEEGENGSSEEEENK